MTHTDRQRAERFRVRTGASLGIAGSLIVHALLVGYVAWQSQRASLGIEFQLPIDVELGTSEVLALAAPPTRSTPIAQPEQGVSEGVGAGAITADAGPAGDASQDAGRRRRRDAGTDSGVPEDSGVDAGPESSATSGMGLAANAPAEGVSRDGIAAYAPPGAQLALRLDLARIRASPLAADARALLAVIPDWRLLLEGSGIDPLDDLERVLIASPNLQRDRIVLAGRYAGDEARVRAAVQAIAASRGLEAPWRDEGGYAVAPWQNQDETERVLALVGAQQFTITRPEDLPRVLAVARARADELARANREGEPQAPDLAADALLAMREREVLSLEVDGARRYVRQAPPELIPTRAWVSVVELDEPAVEVRGEGVFESPEAAEVARAAWDTQRQRMAGDFGVRISGFQRPLEELELVVEGARLTFRTRLSHVQIRFLLGLARGMFTQPRPAPAEPPPPVAPPGESAAPIPGYAPADPSAPR